MGETLRRRRRKAKSATTAAPDLAAFLLRVDLAVASRERAVAQWEQDPFQAAFRAAHAYLAALPARPETSKANRLAAYDARMKAGHAWHPSRSRLREAVRWIKAIEEDLKWYE